MFSSAALEVAIGLIFVYVVISLVCSGMSEALGTVFDWRAKILAGHIERFLSGRRSVSYGGIAAARRFYEHPLMAAVSPGMPLKRARLPERIPPPVAASILVDIATSSEDRSSRSTGERTGGDPSEAGPLLDTLVERAEGDDARLHASLVELFSYTDALVDNEYRGRIRDALLFWATVVTIVLNIDTVHIAEVLLSDATGETGEQSFMLPFGWSAATLPDSVRDLASKGLGLFLTVGAVSFGAEFWLGLLERLGRGPAPSRKT